VRIAYMTALVPDIGGTAMSILADIPQETQTKLEVDVRGLPGRGYFHTHRCIQRLTAAAI